MVTYTTRVLKFSKQAEKTGWTYIEISKVHANKINPGCRVSFRVKGLLDSMSIKQVAILPMGDGAFILPFNAKIRKGTGKKEGDTIKVSLDLDESEIKLSADLMACLKAEPEASKFFKSLTPSHQKYFSKWIEEAKTAATKTRRLVMALEALSKGMGFPEMIRANKGK